MTSQSVVIMNKAGIHARPASLFIKESTRFKSDIMVHKDDNKGNAKSLISILSLGITSGTEIQISADGEDEKEAVEALVRLVESKFGEV